MNRKLWLLMTWLLVVPAFVQAASVRGVVVDYETNKPIANVKVAIRNVSAVTDFDGNFELEKVRAGSVVVVFTAADYKAYSVDFVVNDGVNTLNASLQPKKVGNTLNQQALEDNIFELDESAIDDEGSAASQSASYLSGAADDVYLQAASYSYSPMRFNVRGYEQRESSTYINGLNFNDLERGRFNYSSLGGLNNAMRNKDAVNGLEMPGYAYGSLGGTTNINTRATNYAAGTNVNAAYTNRAYKLRGQAIYSTGIMDNGWAFTGSVVYRWADEGRTEGTFYNSFGYFLAAEKVLGDHRFALTTFGAPTKRAQSAAVSQEVYDYRGIYYNPYWGYQDGEKRNSRIVHSYDPTAIFNWDWKIDDESKLSAGVGFHYSQYSNSAIAFYNAPDPRPDYYRNLPSWQYYQLAVDGPDDIYNAYYKEVNKGLANQIADLWRAGDPNVTQINWNAMYSANYANNAINPEGSAKYILERRHNNLMEIPLNFLYTNQLNSELKLTAGIEAKYAKGMHYKTIDDLLGANQWIDIDQFAERDFTDNQDIIQNDLDDPNRVVYKGDKFGYNYNMHVINASAFIQNDWKLPLFDIYYAARLSYTSFQREGLMRNGRAEVVGARSKGLGKQMYFIDPSIKAGIVYKIDGHNRLSLNALAESRAPLAGYAYVAPRIKDTRIRGLKSEKVFSADLTYQLNTSIVKGRVTGFFTEFRDGVESTGYYHDEFRTYVNHTLSGVNKRHFGVEAGVSVKLNSSFTISAAGTYGSYKYTNDCMGTMSAENGMNLFTEQLPVIVDGRAASTDYTEKVYTEGLHVSNGPQLAASITLDYFHPKMWFADITLSYFDNNYLDFSPSRFTHMNMYGGKYPNEVGLEQNYNGYRIIGIDKNGQTSMVWSFDQKTGKPVLVRDYTGNKGSDIVKYYNQKEMIGSQEKLKGGFLLDASVGKLIYLNNRKQQLNINLSFNNILNNTSMITGGYQQGRVSRDNKSVTKDIQSVDKFPNKYYYAWGFNMFINVGFKF